MKIGPYEVLGELGRGGMGVVFHARRPDLNREFALKVILPGKDASPDAVERFRREAQAAAALADHPGIVGVHDIGEASTAPGQPPKVYFAMDYVDGPPLDRLIDEGEMQPRDAARLVEQAARAVHHAHTRGFLHRDLKPSNILVTKRGEARITDW